MLLSVAACQKIDIDNTTSDKTSNSKSSTSTSKKDKNTSSKGNEAADEDDDEEDDGGISVGGITEEDNNQTVSPVFPDVPGHAVALGLGNDEYLLVSLKEWKGVHLAKNEGYATEATDVAANYEENGLTGWRIPTKAEASKLYDLYRSSSVMSDNLIALNNVIDKYKGDPIYPWYEGFTPYHYLCENAMSIFSFNQTTTGQISSPPKTTTKTYNLRLVRNITITKK